MQLIERGHAYPNGVLEDFLIHVTELVFPTDFVYYAWMMHNMTF